VQTNSIKNASRIFLFQPNAPFFIYLHARSREVSKIIIKSAFPITIPGGKIKGKIEAYYLHSKEQP
jgi:hypothetical protein